MSLASFKLTQNELFLHYKNEEISYIFTNQDINIYLELIGSNKEFISLKYMQNNYIS